MYNMNISSREHIFYKFQKLSCIGASEKGLHQISVLENIINF